MCCNNNNGGCGCHPSSSPVVLIQQGHTQEEMEKAKKAGYDAGLKAGSDAAGSLFVMGACLGAAVTGAVAVDRISAETRKNALLRREIESLRQ